MRQMAQRAWILAAVLVGLTACSDDAGTAPDGDADLLPIAAVDYCERTMEAYCDFYVRCGRMAVSDLDECRAVFAETCNGKYEPFYVALADAGLLELSPAGVAACNAHLRSVACSDQIRDLDGPCGAMWVGLQGVGGACGIGIESLVCAPGTTCAVDMTFCGECKPLALPGAACGAEASCGSTANCDNQICVARQEAGGACQASSDCLLGMDCDNDICVPPAFVGVGEPCGFYERCPAKSVCVGGVCEAQVMLGENCDATTPCASGSCDASSSLCVALLDAGAGCSASAQCVSGLCNGGFCDSVPGRCFP